MSWFGQNLCWIKLNKENIKAANQISDLLQYKVIDYEIYALYLIVNL